MSNGGNVLDNWEEIDEAGVNVSIQALKTTSATPCERIAINPQSNIDLATPATTTDYLRPTQMKLLQRSNTQDSTTSLSSNQLKSPLDDMSATFQPVMMVLHKPEDEYQSANYTAPIANQTVKILRRPTQATEVRNNGIRPKQPIKTLQQREQEYAEARLRILGSAKNPADEDQRASATTTTTIIATSTTSSTVTTPSAIPVLGLSNNTVTSVATTAKNNSPKIQIATSQYNSTYNQQLQQQQKYQQNYQQPQNYYYNQQQQQQPQPPAYNNNRTYNMNPLLALGPMGPIGQPAQYQTTALPSPQTQQHFKYQQYHQKSPQQQHKSQQQQQQQQQTWSPVVGGSVSSSSVRQQPNDTILRLPRGPDSSTGFQMRR